MFNWNKLSKEDLKGLKDFKASFLAIMILSVLLIVVTIFSLTYEESVLYGGINNEEFIVSVIMYFLIGFFYRTTFNRYVENYKKFRSAFDKARSK